MARMYYANALVRMSERDTVSRIGTTESFLTPEAAYKQIDFWRTENPSWEVYAAWVDDGSGNVAGFACYTDSVGNVYKPARATA